MYIKLCFLAISDVNISAKGPFISPSVLVI